MREAKKLDHCPARDPFGEPLQQPIEHAPVRLAREELVAIDKIQQRHRFAPKRMDDMAIIDDMAMFAAAPGAAARKQDRRSTRLSSRHEGPPSMPTPAVT